MSIIRLVPLFHSTTHRARNVDLNGEDESSERNSVVRTSEFPHARTRGYHPAIPRKILRKQSQGRMDRLFITNGNRVARVYVCMCV
jgi:hypothetical protein